MECEFELQQSLCHRSRKSAESNSWLDSLTLSKGKTHNGGDGQLVPGGNDAYLKNQYHEVIKMRGYPDGPLTKRDYENLLSMPEYAKQAKEDLARLAAIDDAKATVEQGTEDSPNPVEIDNPMPMWKRAGFKDKDELLKLAEME